MNLNIRSPLKHHKYRGDGIMKNAMKGRVGSMLALAMTFGGAAGCAEQARDDESTGDEATAGEAANPELSDELIDLAKAKMASADTGKGTTRHAPCGRTGPNLQNQVIADAPIAGAARQRSGTIALSSTNCTILGVLQPTDDATYFCWTAGNDGFTWTYLQSQRSPFVRGWVRDNLLRNFGSSKFCGF